MITSKINLFAGLILATTMTGASAVAADLTVQVAGITNATGEVACSLFKSASGFPGGSQDEIRQWVPAKVQGTTCHYGDVQAGTYAVAVFQDLKGTHKLETSIIGAPTEPTGVSNNVRPSFGPPAFADASFVLDDKAKKTITITLK